MTTAWGKKIFYECVACAFSTFGTTFLVTAFFMALGCDDYIICTNYWIIQIFLEFRKRLVYKDFILNDTKTSIITLTV